MDLVAPQDVESSQTNDQTHVPCTAALFLTSGPPGRSWCMLLKMDVSTPPHPKTPPFRPEKVKGIFTSPSQRHSSCHWQSLQQVLNIRHWQRDAKCLLQLNYTFVCRHDKLPGTAQSTGNKASSAQQRHLREGGGEAAAVSPRGCPRTQEC